MSSQPHQPIFALSILTSGGGVLGFARSGSVPSLVAGIGIGAAMAVSSIRIRDGLPGGLELATVSSGTLAVPMLRRAARTRAPFPIVMAFLASTSLGYYSYKTYEAYDMDRVLK